MASPLTKPRKVPISWKSHKYAKRTRLVMNVVCGETCLISVARASVLKSRSAFPRRVESCPNLKFLIFTFLVAHPLLLVNSTLHVDLSVLHSHFEDEF